MGPVIVIDFRDILGVIPQILESDSRCGLSAR